MELKMYKLTIKKDQIVCLLTQEELLFIRDVMITTAETQEIMADHSDTEAGRRWAADYQEQLEYTARQLDKLKL
jgi:hypothetical protein